MTTTFTEATPIAVVCLYRAPDGSIHSVAEASGYCRVSPASPTTPGYSDAKSALAHAAEKLDEHFARPMPDGPPLALPDHHFDREHERP